MSFYIDGRLSLVTSPILPGNASPVVRTTCFSSKANIYPVKSEALKDTDTHLGIVDYIGEDTHRVVNC